MFCVVIIIIIIITTNYITDTLRKQLIFLSSTIHVIMALFLLNVGNSVCEIL